MAHLINLNAGRGVSTEERTENTANINTALASDSEIHFPADVIVEIDGNCNIKADTRLHLHGSRLVARGNILSQRLFNVTTNGIRIYIENGTLEGFTEDEVLAAGKTASYGLYGRRDMHLTWHNVNFENLFGNAMQGSAGVSVHIDGGQWRSWFSTIAGGDGAKEYIIRNATFGTVGVGQGLSHQLYINPDVYLRLEDSTFNPTNAGWHVHYYGSDQVGPSRRPTYRDCRFYGHGVFTNPHVETLVSGCEFYGAHLQYRNDALVESCVLVGSRETNKRSSIMPYSPFGKQVRVVNLTADFAAINCEARALGAVSLVRDSNLLDTVITNRVNDGGYIEVRGGRWEGGRIDIGKGYAHIGGRIHLRNVGELNWAGPDRLTYGNIVRL